MTILVLKNDVVSPDAAESACFIARPAVDDQGKESDHEWQIVKDDQLEPRKAASFDELVEALHEHEVKDQERKERVKQFAEKNRQV